jgi:hypothetical protein
VRADEARKRRREWQHVKMPAKYVSGAPPERNS